MKLLEIGQLEYWLKLIYDKYSHTIVNERLHITWQFEIWEEHILKQEK